MIDRVGHGTKQGWSRMPKAAMTLFVACLSIVAATPTVAKAGSAEAPLGSRGGVAISPSASPVSPRVNFVDVKASADTRQVADWVTTTGDNLELPFLIVDKVHARVFAFDADGAPRGSAAVLIGIARGDITPAGIGQRRLADIAPADRITPAGRFISALGNDLGPKDILWIDYDAGISLHRVVRGNIADRRVQRLSSPTVEDNRITYGCINVPANFFDSVVRPLLKGSNGMVYILPEVRPLKNVFAIPR